MFLQKNVHLTSHAEMDQENLALQKHCQTLRMHLENVVKEFATAKHVIKKQRLALRACKNNERMLLDKAQNFEMIRSDLEESGNDQQISQQLVNL